MQIQNALSNSSYYEPSAHVQQAAQKRQAEAIGDFTSVGIEPFNSFLPLSQKAYQIFDKLTMDFSEEGKIEAEKSINSSLLSSAANRYMSSRGIEKLDQQQIVQQFYDQFGDIMPDGVIASMLNSRIGETTNLAEQNFLTQFRDLLEEPTISLDISI